MACNIEFTHNSGWNMVLMMLVQKILRGNTLVTRICHFMLSL